MRASSGVSPVSDQALEYVRFTRRGRELVKRCIASLPRHRSPHSCKTRRPRLARAVRDRGVPAALPTPPECQLIRKSRRWYARSAPPRRQLSERASCLPAAPTGGGRTWHPVERCAQRLWRRPRDGAIGGADSDGDGHPRGSPQHADAPARNAVAESDQLAVAHPDTHCRADRNTDSSSDASPRAVRGSRRPRRHGDHESCLTLDVVSYRAHTPGWFADLAH